MPLVGGAREETGGSSSDTFGAAGTGVRDATDEARLVSILVGSLIFFQRFALPVGGGQVPVLLPLVLVAVGWGVRRRVLSAETVRRQLFLVALLGCAGATTIALWRGLPWSPLSIIFLTATYVPFVVRLREPTMERFHAGLSLFHRLMTVAAVVGIAQIGLQLVGVPYFDLFQMFPSALVMQGYHTSYPVVYGSNIFKANGLVFLEPSFFSQFLALGLVVHVYLRRRGPSAYLLMAGIVASVSGTGIILAVVGVVALGVTDRRRQLVRFSAGLMVAALLVAMSPAGSVFVSRIDESSSSTSSASGRFGVPYDVSVSKLSADPVSLLSGRGPGSAERISRKMEAETGVTAVFPVAPKVALEYGIPAMVIFLSFILTCTLRRVPSVPLAMPLLVMYLALSGSLLQPVTVYTVYVLTSMFARDDGWAQPTRSPAIVSDRS